MAIDLPEKFENIVVNATEEWLEKRGKTRDELRSFIEKRVLRDQEKFFLGETMTKSKGKKKPRNGRSTSREEKHKLKIGKINRNLRLSSAMIDPCSHRYYLSIRIHDTDEGRLLMIDNIHRTNYDIIIREDDVKKPDFK